MNVASKIVVVLFLMSTEFARAQKNDPIVLGYFPSWSESWTSTNANSKLREIPSFVNHIFLSFAKPNLRYTAGSYDISNTGIQTPYDGCTLKESVSALKDKGIKVILSVGGETYWGDPDSYNINYQEIKDLVDDMGFAGIDWDFEPNGSFANIGSALNVQRFKDFFTNSRAIMPKSEGYILACAPSGVGALGGQTNDDPSSPFAFVNRNDLTGETDNNLYSSTAQTNGINLFGFSATGHMIPVFESVGNLIDLVAFQGYNVGGSTNRSIMYDSYAHYADQYSFLLVAGIHYPDEPWGPYYNYSHTNVASLANHLKQHPQRGNTNDGIMIWQILLENTTLNSSAYSYMNVASQVLKGSTESNAIQNANNFSLSPYAGGSAGCSGDGDVKYCGVPEYNVNNSYRTEGTQVFYNCKIWRSKWWASPNEVPEVNPVWEYVTDCNEGASCSTPCIDYLSLSASPTSTESRAAKTISLLPGFVTESGTVFRAEIGCLNN